MSAASDTFWQQQIVREVGDPNATIAVVVAQVWGYFLAKAAIDSQLQILYTKRAAIDQRLAEEQQNFDFSSGKDTFKRSQTTDHLQEMRAEVQTEIQRREAIARANRVPQTGALTTVEAITPPLSDTADASDPKYRGSPYDRTIDF